MREEAEKLIRELVPELQELKVGCILEGWSGNGIVTLIGNREILISWGAKIQTGIQLDEFDEDCILGSEIHLEHILKAIEVWNVFTKTSIFSECLIIETKGNRSLWEFNKPFTEQSEEFYKFLVEILK